MAAERKVARGRVRVASDRGVFMISVAAELAEMHPQTLRMYEARGLIEPRRSPKGTRLYSQEDVELLRRIQEMTAELGLNLAGVERVLALEAELDRLRRRLEALEREGQRLREQAVAEVERVKRSLRAEIVPRPPAEVVAVRRLKGFRLRSDRADRPEAEGGAQRPS
ncbi:MAG: MerR family transcriptional regulator [Actinobacteria bacterium]|nr:MAG: MerR family transcriptional regulator [Actinomycetota bacterium]